MSFEPKWAFDATVMPDWNMLCIKNHGTVFEITDEEWDAIWLGYNFYLSNNENWVCKSFVSSGCPKISFSQYLRELLELKK